MKKPRNVALCIVFSLITFGIYPLYWIYHIHEDMQEVCGRPMRIGGGAVVVITIITCGIYGIYWCYKVGQYLDAARGTPGGYQGILYLILSIVGLNIVAWALMQSELNRFEGWPEL